MSDLYVKRCHVVPVGYLRGFAVNDRIEMHLAADPSFLKVIGVRDAGVIKGFYLRVRPDGTISDDTERSLSFIETQAPLILRSISDRWPLSSEAKAIVAECFGVQHVRGVRWRVWHEEFTRGYVEQLRQAGGLETPDGWHDVTEEELAAIERAWISDTERLKQMISVSRLATQVLGSMWWTLLEFSEPLLATSDHPVVHWPFWRDLRIPGTATVENVLNVLEVRVPVSPTQALLMTWHDAPDDEALRVPSPRLHVRNLNAFTIAEAGRQWFCRPGTRARPIQAAFPPLSQAFFPDYDTAAAQACERFKRATATFEGGRADRFGNDIEIITVARGPQP